MDSSGSKRRQQLIVDRKWQMYVWRLTAGRALVAGVLYVMVGLGVVLWCPLETLSGEGIAFLALALNLTFFLFLGVLMRMVCLRLTHAVAGPAVVIKRAVDGLRAGQYHHRCQLRDHDYLGDLANSVRQLQAHLAQKERSERGPEEERKSERLLAESPSLLASDRAESPF